MCARLYKDSLCLEIEILIATLKGWFTSFLLSHMNG